MKTIYIFLFATFFFYGCGCYTATGRPCREVVVHKPAPQPTYIQPKPVYIPQPSSHTTPDVILAPDPPAPKINLEQTTLKIKPEPIPAPVWTPPKSTPAPVWTPPKPTPPVKKNTPPPAPKKQEPSKKGKWHLRLISYDDNSYQQYQAEKTKKELEKSGLKDLNIRKAQNPKKTKQYIVIDMGNYETPNTKEAQNMQKKMRAWKHKNKTPFKQAFFVKY
ncbi:MAG TPA: hypothetical protein P5543_08725 [Planctomycetota bacterium]|nr:hypothetical protein [Planctomycetota bacterium]HRU52262.1 hypothetical protein [Planctomycetota bacterium]